MGRYLVVQEIWERSPKVRYKLVRIGANLEILIDCARVDESPSVNPVANSEDIEISHPLDPKEETERAHPL